MEPLALQYIEQEAQYEAGTMNRRALRVFHGSHDIQPLP
jgi:hypothetical protein